MKFRILFLLALCSTAPQLLFAQPFLGLDQSSTYLEVTPALPQPLDEFKVTLNDYTSTLYGSGIQWFVNDIPVPDSDNRRSISLQAGGANSRSVIKAILGSPGGPSETITTIVNPIYLDVIIEPQTHVPDFFLGRAIASAGSNINLTALLDNGSLLDRDFIYTWTINGEVFDGGPIRGRNSISYIASQDTINRISVEVSTLAGEIVARRTLSIPITAPRLVFYEENPLYGLSQKAIRRELIMTGNNAIVRAVPYYLNSIVFNNPDIIGWEIDNSLEPGDSDNPYNISLEGTGEPGGATLDFNVRSTTQFLQFAQGSITIQI